MPSSFLLIRPPSETDLVDFQLNKHHPLFEGAALARRQSFPLSSSNSSSRAHSDRQGGADVTFAGRTGGGLIPTCGAPPATVSRIGLVNSGGKMYDFERIFDESTSPQSVFDAAASQSVASVLSGDGVHSTVVVTGTGDTPHTDTVLDVLIPATARKFFDTFTHSTRPLGLAFSAMSIEGTRVFDLLHACPVPTVKPQGIPDEAKCRVSVSNLLDMQALIEKNRALFTKVATLVVYGMYVVGDGGHCHGAVYIADVAVAEGCEEEDIPKAVAMSQIAWLFAQETGNSTCVMDDPSPLPKLLRKCFMDSSSWNAVLHTVGPSSRCQTAVVSSLLLHQMIRPLPACHQQLPTITTTSAPGSPLPLQRTAPGTPTSLNAPGGSDTFGPAPASSASLGTPNPSTAKAIALMRTRIETMANAWKKSDPIGFESYTDSDPALVAQLTAGGSGPATPDGTSRPRMPSMSLSFVSNAEDFEAQWDRAVDMTRLHSSTMERVLAVRQQCELDDIAALAERDLKSSRSGAEEVANRNSARLSAIHSQEATLLRWQCEQYIAYMVSLRDAELFHRLTKSARGLSSRRESASLLHSQQQGPHSPPMSASNSARRKSASSQGTLQEMFVEQLRTMEELVQSLRQRRAEGTHNEQTESEHLLRLLAAEQRRSAAFKAELDHKDRQLSAAHRWAVRAAAAQTEVDALKAQVAELKKHVHASYRPQHLSAFTPPSQPLSLSQTSNHNAPNSPGSIASGRSRDGSGLFVQTSTASVRLDAPQPHHELLSPPPMRGDRIPTMPKLVDQQQMHAHHGHYAQPPPAQLHGAHLQRHDQLLGHHHLHAQRDVDNISEASCEL